MSFMFRRRSSIETTQQTLFSALEHISHKGELCDDQEASELSDALNVAINHADVEKILKFPKSNTNIFHSLASLPCERIAMQALEELHESLARPILMRLIVGRDNEDQIPVQKAMLPKVRSPIIKLLLQSSGNIQLQNTDSHNESILSKAVVEGNVELFELMLPYITIHVLNTQTGLYRDSLLARIAKSSEALTFLKRLFEVHALKIRVNSAGMNGKTALHVLVERTEVGAVRELLQHGASANVNDRMGLTPLHVLACRQTVEEQVECEVAALLLETGHANPNWRTCSDDRDTPLHCCIKTGRALLAQMLIQHGADPTLKNAEGMVVDMETLSLVRSEDTGHGLRIQVVSDLHIEFYRGEVKDDLIVPQAPYLALIGDIGIAGSDQFRDFLCLQSSRFERVWLIAGNHEYYHNEIDEANAWMKETCDALENVIFMDRDAEVLHGVRILGSTLWSFVPEESVFDVENGLNDYRLIKVKKGEQRKRISVHDTNQLHQETLEWMKQELSTARTLGQPVVVLTHHSPVERMGDSSPEYHDSGIRHAFATDLAGGDEPLVNEPVLAWCYGHTHWPNDVVVNGVRIVSNPAGYVCSPVKAYDSGLVLDV